MDKDPDANVEKLGALVALPACAPGFYGTRFRVQVVAPPPHHFAPPPALGGSRIGGCVPPALGYDFVVIPNRLARFGGSKTRLYWRLCPAGSWLSSRASPFSNVPRDARIGGCAPPALGYDFAETYIHMYMMA